MHDGLVTESISRLMKIKSQISQCRKYRVLWRMRCVFRSDHYLPGTLSSLKQLGSHFWTSFSLPINIPTSASALWNVSAIPEILVSLIIIILKEGSYHDHEIPHKPRGPPDLALDQ